MRANNPLPPLLVSEREIARLLNVCAATPKNWRHQFGLPSYKIGGRRLYDPQEVLAWAKERFADKKTAPATTEAERKEGGVTP